MSAQRVAAVGLALCVCLGAAPLWAAQAEESRASVPPGKSLDGAPPIGGAIVGGSIQRSDETVTPLERERCRDLTGTLKTQCLRDARMRAPIPRSEAAESEPVSTQR